VAKDSELEVDWAPVTAALAKITEETARKMVQDALPGLVEKAVSEEKVLITETIQEIARKSLPDILKPIVDQLAKEVIEQVVREVVAATAEAEVMKEIERLKAEA
jgi:hypothetical protein